MPHEAGHSYQDLIGQAQANSMIDELQGLLSPSQTYSPSGNVTGPQISQGVDYTGMSSGSIDQLINSVAGSGGIGGLFGSIFDNIGPIASTAGGLASVMNAYNRLGSIGDFANFSARQIGEDAFARSQFKPFTVTTGTGSSVGVGIPAPGSFPTTDARRPSSADCRRTRAKPRASHTQSRLCSSARL